MQKVIVILGPTASGKTKLSIDLAKEINGSIISADSMQIYKYMDIGTAKPSDEEKENIPHYGMDILSPDEQFSVAGFKKLALEKIECILNQGRTPMVVGGTGLYLSTLMDNIEFSKTDNDWELREQLSNIAKIEGNQKLWEMLNEFDPESATRLHPNDTKRVSRAIEVYRQTGKTMSQHIEDSRKNPSKYKFVKIGISMEREVLYERINKRVDMMMEMGLVEEVKKLIQMGYGNCKIAMQALGYKEIMKYLNGEISIEESVELLKMETRRFAKRQLTWFRRIEGIYWVNPNSNNSGEEIIKNLEDYIERF